MTKWTLRLKTFGMYPPFEVNNLLGPLLVLACFGKALLLYFALKAMEYYFQEEEATWRKD